MKKKSFINLLKATRIERSFYIISMILVPVAFTNNFSLDILILSICCALLYSVSGIQNAKRDKDYSLPDYYKIFIIILLSITFLLSLTNKIIFLAVIIETFLGVFYNTISRKILFGDATILGLTHAGIPILASSYITGLNFNITIKLAGIFYIFIWLLGNVRNHKDKEQDKKRKYKTYATQFKNSEILTKMFLLSSFLIILISSFIFELNKVYLIMISLEFLLYMTIILLNDVKKEKIAMQLSRLSIIIFSISFILAKTKNTAIIYFEFILLFLFLIVIFPNIKQEFSDKQS